MADDHLIEEFDPTTAPEDEFRARWEVITRLDAEMEPESPATPFEKHREWMLDRPSFHRPKYWTAWDAERRDILGYGYLDLEYVETNRHLSWIGIGVEAGARRRGIGTALLGAIAEAAAADGRTMLGVGSIEGTDGDRFCEAVGFDRKATERKSRLTMANVDRAMLESWVAKAGERAADYELVAFDDRCPDELLDAFVDLKLVTNTAPRDDLEMEDNVETPERYRESEAKALARGDTWWRLIARHRPTGELAGFTEFFFTPYASEEVAWQGWTAVRPTHRDRGIGRWLKAVNCLRLMDEQPGVRFVDTWNAFSNGPMLGINIEMGFELIRGYNEWQAPTDRLASAVKERLGR
jgi:mycothiol synthase